MITVESFDPSTPTTAFILSPSTSLRVNAVVGLRAPLRSGNDAQSALATAIAVAKVVRVLLVIERSRNVHFDYAQ